MLDFLRWLPAPLLLLLLLQAAAPLRAQGNYEVQVYGSEMVPPARTMFELHSNFTFQGSKFAVDGVRADEHALHETIEITQGFTPWFETGFYVFMSYRAGEGYQWVGDHIRPRVRIPEAWHWPVNVSLSTETAQVAEVYGDWGRLRQLVLILLDNALKYTGAGGEVSVKLASRNREAILTVSDTGIGIGASDLPHIFDRFWRADKVRSRQEGGSGLGLSIAQKIAEQSGGQITVESEVGSGSRFVVTLPLVVADAAEGSMHMPNSDRA